MSSGNVAVSSERVELRRDVTIRGSYTWGYADVGTDIYIALGLVIGAAQGGAPPAFALAGLIYILIGLAFTELASSYPVAGGGHYYSLRGLGDFSASWRERRCSSITPLTLPSLPPPRLAMPTSSCPTWGSTSAVSPCPLTLSRTSICYGWPRPWR